MHYLPKPIRLQIELSNVCNAKCLHCKRNELDFSTLETMLENNVNVSMDNLPVKTSEDYKTKQHLPVDLITKLLKDAPSIKELYLCGSIDDPLGYKHLLELFENIVTDKPNMFIGVHTNGSMRNPAFFLEWGKILKKTNHSIWFSIDGLEDTNHLYRKNCNWNKIMENASALISTGARVSWQMLVFPWNKHQIEEARQLAKKMGFREFRTRVNKDPRLDNLDKFITHIKLKKNLVPKNLRKLLDKMSDEEILTWRNNKQIAKPFSDTVSVEPIMCEWKHEMQQYHLSYDGRLWPCCYINSATTKYDIELKRRLEMNYDKDFNNLHKHSWNEIISHKFYTNDLVSSWSANTHGYRIQDRIPVCTKNCAKNIAFPAKNESSLENFKDNKKTTDDKNDNVVKERSKNINYIHT